LELPQVNRAAWRNLGLCGLLVAIAVAGRWFGASVDWTILPPNFTPIVAVGLFAGFLFSSRTMALSVPLVALAISNLALDSYGSVWMGAIVYGSFLAAPLMGRWLRIRPTATRTFISVLLPAALFFVTTNFAHWLMDIQHTGRAYAANWHGLLACYARGIPFFRWMLEGDVAFSAMLFGAYFVAVQSSRLPFLPLRRKRLACPARVGARVHTANGSAHVRSANSRC
jgi:hypothetical protein